MYMSPYIWAQSEIYQAPYLTSLDFVYSVGYRISIEATVIELNVLFTINEVNTRKHMQLIELIFDPRRLLERGRLFEQGFRVHTLSHQLFMQSC